MITAVSRDFRVATYSVVSFTETSFAVSTFTSIPEGPWGWAPRTAPPLHATPSIATAKAAANPACGREHWAGGKYPLTVGKSISWNTPDKAPAFRLDITHFGIILGQ